eukprot:scaffold61238_cov64-Phaeocystis_antarctica.AAC.5
MLTTHYSLLTTHYGTCARSRGYWTLTATSSPLRASTARCTCASDAAPIGVGSKEVKTASSGPPSSSSSSGSSSLSATPGLLSSQAASTAGYGVGST